MSTARRFVVVSDGVRREWSAERIYKTASRSCDPSADQPWPSGRGWRLVSHGTLRALSYAGSVSRVLRFLAQRERLRGAREVRVYDRRGALVIG